MKKRSETRLSCKIRISLFSVGGSFSGPTEIAWFLSYWIWRVCATLIEPPPRPPKIHRGPSCRKQEVLGRASPNSIREGGIARGLGCSSSDLIIDLYTCTPPQL